MSETAAHGDVVGRDRRPTDVESAEVAGGARGAVHDLRDRSVQPEGGIDWNAAWRASRSLGADRSEDQDEAYWNGRAVEFPIGPKAGFYTDAFLERAAIRPGETVMDVGCCTGSLALPLAQAGHHVTAVDISQGMLSKLRAWADEHGLGERIDTVRGTWLGDWSHLPVADVLIASRSFRADDLRAAILKMEAHARRQICVTLATTRSPFFDPLFTTAIGRPLPVEQECVYLVNMLYQMGRLPEVSYLTHVKPPTGATLDDVFADYARFCAPYTEQEEAAARAFIAEHFAPGPDGRIARDYEWRCSWAFIRWEPVRG